MEGCLDAQVCLQTLDLLCEICPLEVNRNWARETQGSAREAGDQQRVGFYESLLKAMKLEYKEVCNEIATFSNANQTGTPFSSMHSSYLEITDATESEGELSKSASTTSYMTARVDISQNRRAHVGNLIDLEPSPQLESKHNNRSHHCF